MNDDSSPGVDPGITDGRGVGVDGPTVTLMYGEEVGAETLK